MKTKAQTTIEFLILIAAVMLFFTAFLIVVNNNIATKSREKINLQLNELALTIKSEIDLATNSLNGYSRSFEIPNYIGNLDYQPNITEGHIYLRTTDEKYSLAIPVNPVTGNIQKGSNLIRKINDTVYLN